MITVHDLSAKDIGKVVTVLWGTNALTGRLGGIDISVETEEYLAKESLPYVTGITLQVGRHQIYLRGGEEVIVEPK